MPKIKFCGIRRFEDIDYVNELRPDYIGFVFWAKSRRYVTPETAKMLKQRLNPDIKAVGVFVDENLDTITSLLKEGIIDIAQLHGSESEEDIAELRVKTDAPIIKAFKIKSAADIENACKSSADFVLLDSGYGTGKAFDWNLFQSLNRPFFLAGGISADNIGEAINRFSPYAVDLSSAIEINGMKDKTKMREIMQLITRS